MSVPASRINSGPSEYGDMKKMWIIIGLVAVALVAVAGGLFWYVANQPLYKPGMVRVGKNLRAPLTPPEQPDDEHRWRVEPDVQLYHFSAGEGADGGRARDVLIVHGGPGYPYAEPWPGLEPLTSENTFHYYDQRGCGQSTRPIDTFSSGNTWENMKTLEQTLGLSAQVADIERIRRILGQDKLILVGHSFGGFLASLYAAEFPEHVAGMVLVAPANVLVLPQKEGGIFGEIRGRLPEDRREAYDAFVSDYLSFKDVFSKSEAELVALNEELAEYYRIAADEQTPEQGEAAGWGVQAVYLSMGKRHDYRDSLQAVRAPVLVVHGAVDVYQPEGASRSYADAFPRAEFRLIQKAGHFPFYTQPDVFARVVGEFLDGS
jgi:proline iminopeptidase